MSFSSSRFDEELQKSISNSGGRGGNEDDQHDAEAGNAIDPSLIVPDGLSRRICRESLVNPPDVDIQRRALTVAKKHEEYNYEKPIKPGLCESLSRKVKKKTKCSVKKARETIYLRIPILDWLLHYKIRSDLFNDVISGVTVAVMNIPQGMAYAMLANLDPIVGIYMAFFPVLIYAAFASSRHCSMGTFAVICIMAGKVISQLATFPDGGSSTAPLDPAANSTTEYSPTEVATILSFAIGIWMVIFGLLQLGSLCVFLSDMLVSGFTTGASIHVLTSQVPKLFGMETESYEDIFQIPKTWYSIFANVLYSNPATMVISLVCFFVLIVNNEVFKPRLRKITRVPFPVELVVVIVGTLASTWADLNENFDVEVVGDIPTGLPPLKAPPFELYGQVIVSSLTITIVSFTVSFSMAKIFATRLDYTVDATQELYALGLGNIFGSLFSCGPISASLSRSLIQQAVGGVTQLASYISCSLLVLVLLYIGPFFETLPNSVLAAIIAVALKGMFLQFADFITMWKVSRKDAMLWLITFLGVVILDIDYGLLLGIIVALLLLIVQNQTTRMTLLGRISRTDIFLDITRYSRAEEVPGIKICGVMGSLHFANQDAFRQNLAKTTGLDPRAILKWKAKQERLLQARLKEVPQPETSHETEGAYGNNLATSTSSLHRKEDETSPIEISLRVDDSFNNHQYSDLTPNFNSSDVIPDVVSLIIDFSGVSCIDVSAAKNIASLHKEYQVAGVVVAFASLSDQSLELMMKCGASEALEEEVFFHSVSDAVAFFTTPVSVPPEVSAHL